MGNTMKRREIGFLRGMHRDWVWPPSGRRLLLAQPDAGERARAFVCSDGTFSPGIGSFGVTALYRPAGGDLLRPAWEPQAPGAEGAPATSWHALDGSRCPCSELVFEVGRFSVTEKLIASGTPRDPTFHWRIAVRNLGGRARRLAVHVCVRAFGPAGGALDRLEWRGSANELLANGRAVMRASRRPERAGCLSYSATGLDASSAAASGAFPTESKLADALGLASCLLVYDVALSGRETAELDFGFAAPTGGAPPDPNFARAKESSRSAWAGRLGGFDVSLPDPAAQEALYGSLHNVLAGVWGGEAHISPVSYPMRWLRDGVYLVDALVKAGLPEIARTTVEGFMEEPWAGGAGPEADAPGELLWAMGEYYRYTGDRAFLSKARRAIEQAVADIEAMRRLETGPYVVGGVPVAWPAEGGLLRGRMDYDIQPVWVNAWAIRGLFEAATLARSLGREEESKRIRAEAERLLRVFTKRVVVPRVELSSRPENFSEALRAAGYELSREEDASSAFANPRDLSCLLWPCRAAGVDIRPWARAYFQRVKMRQGAFFMDPNWRYFDLAQAHNYLWAGLPELAWMTLDSYLARPDAPSGWAEIGASDIDRARWDALVTTEPPEVVLPHGWVSAEMFLLLRDMLFFEDGERLVLLSGLRPEWRAEGKTVEVASAPTPWGKLSMAVSGAPGGRLAGEVHLEGEPPGGLVLAPPGIEPMTLPPGGGRFSVDIAGRVG